MTEPDRFRARSHRAERVGGALIVQVLGGPTRALPQDLARLLRRMDRFRTLDRYLTVLDGDRAVIEGAIEQLQELGLVENETEFWSRSPQREPDPVSIDRIAITGAAPHPLHRTLRSLGGEGPPVVIIDTSESPQALTSRRRVLHLDRAAIARFADVLGTRTGHPRESRLALEAANNVLLLHGVEGGLVSLHAGTVARAHRLADYGPGRFHTLAAADPQLLLPVESLERAVEAHPTSSVELHTAFSGVLGQPAEVLIGSTRLGGRARLLDRIAAGSRVVAARGGVLGDAGLTSASAWLGLRGEALNALAAEAAIWERQRVRREVLNVASKPCLTDTPTFQAQAWGVDLRTFVPPFPTWGLAADRGWGALLHQVRRDALVAHLPLAFERHTDAPPWDLTMAAGGVAHLRFCDLVVDAILRHPSPADAPQPRLVHAGHILIDLASLPTSDFTRWLHEVQLRTLAARLRRLRAPVHEGIATGFLEARRRAVVEIQTALESGQLRITETRSLPEVQRRLGQQGQIWRAWPDLWSASAEIRPSESA